MKTRQIIPCSRTMKIQAAYIYWIDRNTSCLYLLVIETGWQKMTYTAQNIENIKRGNNLENYIEHEEKLIATLDNATIAYDLQGKDTVSFGHLYGRYGIDTEAAAPYNVVASVTAGDWNKEWPVAGFDGSQSRARAYAKKALENQLQELGSKILSEARARLATLRAAL